MAELPNREELEAILAKAVGKEFALEFEELMAALGEPPDPANLPSEFWEGKRMRATVEPLLMNTFLVSAEDAMIQLTIGVDWGLVNQSAIDWASRYTFDLVTGINNTSRGVIQRGIDAYFRDGLSNKELASLLEPTFGPVRAEMIAVTETTRASVEGGREIDRQIEKDNPNIRMIPIWLTANDDRVCPICGPRHNQPITNGEYPPAHPRCRCDYRSEMTVIE